jgi:DNA-binding LacI/PurR family transcriptional regulator
METLLSVIEGRSVADRVIAPQLVVRESTAPPRVNT